MSNHPLHRFTTSAAALAFAATVTLSLLSTISMLADQYRAQALADQSPIASAQPAAGASAQPRS